MPDYKDLIRDIYNEISSIEKAEMEKLKEESLQNRIAELRKLGKTQQEIDAQLVKDKQELQKDLEKKNYIERSRQELEDVQKRAEVAATLQEKNALKAREKELEKTIEIEERKKKNAEEIGKIYEKTVGALTTNLGSTLLTGASAMYDSINKSIKEYSSYFEEMQVRLLGSGKTYSSVADLLSKTFSGSPFFAMSDVMNQTKTFIQQGIAYNVELRASLQTISEKIAVTFNALDATLLRLVRIQGDSTQARLGIESKITNLLNSQFQDTSYLASNLNEAVSASLLEAEARLGRVAGTKFEYEAQKWLGSLYSVGASQGLINQLASGLGYLGSGDVSGLSSNAALTNLLAVAASKGGGASLGDLMTRGATATDISALMTGLYSLVQEVSKTNNVVALKEYASVFGMSISDLKSVLNLTASDIKTLTEQTLSYNDALETVTNQLNASTLLNRTHVSRLLDNLTSNIVDSIASGIAGNAAGYIGWKMAGIGAELTKGIEINAAPFGVGVNTTVSEAVKAAATAAALGANLNKLFSGLSNLGGVNLTNLGGTDLVSRGKITDLSPGTRRNYVAFEGDTETSTIYKQSSMQAETQVSRITDSDMDAKKKETEETLNRLKNIDDNIELMVRLLDSDGIVIRGRVGETSSSYANQLAGIGGIFQG